MKIDPLVKNQFTTFAINNYKNVSLFLPNGPGRQFCNLTKNNTEVTEIANQIWNAFYEQATEEYYVEPLFGIFLGLNTEGGSVHIHKDPAPENFHHVRINLLLSKPIEGGLPIINDNTVEIEEDDCWLNIASTWYHGSTPVVGVKPRIVLSLGALLPLNASFLQPYLKEYEKTRL